MTAIELALAPDHATRLFRHKAISTLRRGRTRTETAGITWHDVRDPDLAAAGVMLTEQRGAWRLVRPLRLHGFPAGSETLAEAASPEALDAGMSKHAPPGQPGPGRPVARAALLGRMRRVELAPPTEGGDPLAVTLLEGKLRNVTEEVACCRVLLEGEPAAAARLAMALGETLPIAAARCSLGEAALALGGFAPEPEPPGPGVPVGADVDEAMAHVLGALACALLRWIPDIEAGGEGHAVHQARVAIRRFRSALLIFKPVLAGSLDPLAPKLVALARSLGAARDWDVFLDETASEIAEALDGDRRILALLADAGTRRAAAYAKLRTELATPSVRRLLLHLAVLPSLRPWRDVAGGDEADEAASPGPRQWRAQPVATYARAMLDKRYKRLVSAGKHLDALPVETLHEVRKSAKKLRYALEFFQPVLPRGDTKRLIRLLSQAQGQLGALNDTATGAALIGTIAPSGAPSGGRHDYAAGAVAGWLAARAREAAAPLGETWSALRHQARFWRGE